MSRSRFVQGACLFVWVLGAVGIVSASQEKNSLLPPQENLTQLAKDLEIQGNWPQAFAVYLKFPGGERCAALIARDDPKTYLAALDTIEAEANHPPNPRLWLVRADLLIQLGKNAEALACYRKFVAAIGQTPDQTWETGRVPWFYYPVSPQPLGSYVGGPPKFEYQSQELQPALPFQIGPGSQADNWLIQRFLTLNAWQDASNEFERVWKLHQVAASGNQLGGTSLRFALEYAFFLSKINQPQKGLDLLLNVFSQLDLERNPTSTELRSSLEVQPLDLKQNPNSRGLKPGFERQPLYPLKTSSKGYTPIEFIRLAYGQFQIQNQQSRLNQSLQHQIDAGRNQARWVLACVLQLEGKEDAALATELEYLHQGGFNKLTIAYRSGLAFERYNRPKKAVIAFEECLRLTGEGLSLPQPDDHEQFHNLMTSNSSAGIAGFWPHQTPRDTILKHLFEAYCVLGETEKALRTGLERLEIEAYLKDEDFNQLCNLFTLAGQNNQFKKWIQTHLEKYSRVSSRKASLAWILEDQNVVIESLASLAKSRQLPNSEFIKWLALISQQKKEWRRPFLEALVAADPENQAYRHALSSTGLNPTPPENLGFTPNVPKINPDSSMVSGPLQNRDSETISLKGVERPSIHQRIRFNHRSFGQSFFSQRQVTGQRNHSSDSNPSVQNPCGSPITADSLRQLINKPPGVSRNFNNDRVTYNFNNDCLQALGAALLTHPELVQLLLESQPDTVDQLEHYRHLVKGIFSYADRRLLAKVHQALTSPNMIIRRNAAYACAGFGDQASIPLLIQALKTESSLVRKGVIWSLGELKARQAVPAIMKLLLEAHHPFTRNGHTFRTDEMNRALERHYQKLKTNTPPLAQPEADYGLFGDPRWLLNDFDYVQSLIAIGPEYAQAYFRFEAWNPGIASYRKFAPTYLAECLPADKIRNREILRSLAAKGSAEAAVSLLILGDTAVEAAILNWLNNRHPAMAGQLIKELVRVKDKSKLAFARSTLTQIAQDESVYSNMRQAAKALIKE